MVWNVAVNYGNCKACFTITKENKGVYYAALLKVSGQHCKNLPASITLVKGMRHWWGSYDDQILLDQLGHAIESSKASWLEK